MTEITRTLILSPPEVWAMLDDEARMREWAGELTGSAEPVEVEVRTREEGRRLVWEPAPAKGVSEARIEATLEEKGFGTRVAIRSELRAAALLPSARREAEDSAQQRMGELLDRAVDQMGQPTKRPFSAT